MLFLKNEKVFSLRRTFEAVPFGDIQSLWSEFFCYLLVAGFYREGEGSSSVYPIKNNIGDEHFFLGEGAYHHRLGNTLTKGLKDRYTALRFHHDLTETELSLLDEFNGLFSNNSPTFWNLSARKIINVAFARDLTDDMRAIAHYVSVMYGQEDFVEPTKLPRVYLTMFGNIHLSREDSIEVTEPLILYRRIANRTEVSPMYAFVSAHLNALADKTIFLPGHRLCDMISSYSLLAASSSWGKSITLPRAASATYISGYLGINWQKTGSLTSRFYQQFLYGRTGKVEIVRQSLFSHIVNLMVNKMGDDIPRSHVFADDSNYLRLWDRDTIYGTEPRNFNLLEYALEALDSAREPDEGEETQSKKTSASAEDEDDEDALTPPEVDPITDPSTESGGFDPSVPPPAVPSSPRAEDKDTIDLISFDKTGEGVNEDLYRSAVVALNDRLKSDDSVPVDANVKDELDYWVNGFLYRTAISATKEQIASLGLQKYLK